MSHLVRSMLVIAGASALGASRLQAQSNILELVVVNGPHAGTYKPPAEDVSCIHYKAQQIYAATWIYLDDQVKNLAGKAPGAKPGANVVTEASISISNPDDKGAKFGALVLQLGWGKTLVRYTVDHTPLTLTVKGKGAEIVSQGKTKDGIQLRVTAKCSEVETM